MTVQTATQHHVPVRSAGLAIAGLAFAAGAAFGVTQLVSSGETAIAPVEPRVTITDGARDSWEGRLEPAPIPGTEHGVRDSWMPPGTTSRTPRSVDPPPTSGAAEAPARLTPRRSCS